MTCGKVVSLFVLIVSAVHANMRAPIIVERAPTRLAAKDAALLVLQESLEFRCPAAFKGKHDMKAFAERTCDATIRYRVASTGVKAMFSFFFSGQGEVRWHAAGKTSLVKPRMVNVEDKHHCWSCPEDMRHVLVAEEMLELPAGQQDITIEYKQALSYFESGHGYFSEGKWRQEFTYELWPLAEWQWQQQQIMADLSIRIAARPGFLGFGHKSDEVHCEVRSGERDIPIALSTGEVIAGERQYTAQFELLRQPQRLHCYWSAK